MVRARIATAAMTAAISGLALVPASGGAALTPFGSDLLAPANVSSARPVDTAYWQAAFAGGRSVVAPASGQIRSVRIKGIALSSPLAGVPGGETDFHIQVAQPLPDGTFQVRDPGGTSGNLKLPQAGADPQVVTTYEPENLCVRQGDIVIFNTVGGWDAGSGLYPNGTPLQIFSRVPNAVLSGFTAADKTNNGDILTTTPLPDAELLMQATVGSGPDGTGLCPGGTAGLAGPGATPPPPPPPPPAAATVQKATLPAAQRVTVSSKGTLGVSLFCRTGPSRCAGTVRVKTRGTRPISLGLGTFDVASGRTGRASIRLNRTGRRRFFVFGRGRLRVTIAAETRPGGASRRATLAVTLRRRGS